MHPSTTMTFTRRACLAVCAAAALSAPLAVQAQALQEVTYLLPAPGTLPGSGLSRSKPHRSGRPGGRVPATASLR